MNDVVMRPARVSVSKITPKLTGNNAEDAAKIVDAVQYLFDQQSDIIRTEFEKFANGQEPETRIRAYYPRVEVNVKGTQPNANKTAAFGWAAERAIYAANITRPDVFRSYLIEQFETLLSNNICDVTIGLSGEPMLLQAAYAEHTGEYPSLSEEQSVEIAHFFDTANVIYGEIDHKIVDHDIDWEQEGYFPLTYHSASAVDVSLARIRHYTGTNPETFQNFIIFTNYKKYMNEFRQAAHSILLNGVSPHNGFSIESKENGPFIALVDPDENRVVLNQNIPNVSEIFASVAPNTPVETSGPAKEYQMPAYHLMRADGSGISIVNVGVGPSNAKNITDHVAVLRPHAWMMLGHCAGLKHNQMNGHYVLANAYARHDKVLDDKLPPALAPITPIAEIQKAIYDAVLTTQHLSDDISEEEIRSKVKEILRSGTVVTDADRNWEFLAGKQIIKTLSLARAVALDMESATIAANGYRHRVPYGTLLCVSDKPAHGQVKLPGMAQDFYRALVGEHFWAGMIAMQNMAEMEDSHVLHSRKLNSPFGEPVFR